MQLVSALRPTKSTLEQSVQGRGSLASRSALATEGYHVENTGSRGDARSVLCHEVFWSRGHSRGSYDDDHPDSTPTMCIYRDASSCLATRVSYRRRYPMLQGHGAQTSGRCTSTSSRYVVHMSHGGSEASVFSAVRGSYYDDTRCWCDGRDSYHLRR